VTIVPELSPSEPSQFGGSLQQSAIGDVTPAEFILHYQYRSSAAQASTSLAFV